MIRLFTHDLLAALQWLTTTNFEQSPFELLVVALDSNEQGRLSQKLSEGKIARKLHRSESAVILTLAPSHTTPITPYPVQNTDLNAWMQNLVQSKSFGDQNTISERNAFDTILKLLNIPTNLLPILYIRAFGGSPLLLPVEDIDRTIELLLELFEMAQDARMSGENCSTLIEETLVEHGLYAQPLTTEHQTAIDAGLANSNSRKPSDETWRVHSLLYGEKTDATKTTNIKTMVHALNNFLSYEHAETLNTALYAYNRGDFGTVCRNIGAVIEGSLGGSLIHIVRGRMGISLPHFIDLQDPSLGKVTIEHIDVNARQHYIGDTSRGSKIQWKSPVLSDQLVLLPLASEHQHLNIALNNRGWKTIVELARASANLRNPAAHGASISRTQAEEAWNILTQWYKTGCAETLCTIRKDIRQWPDLKIPLTILENIHEGFLETQQKIQQLLATWSTEAYHELAALNQPTQESKKVTLLQETISHLGTVLENTHSPMDLSSFALPSELDVFIEFFPFTEQIHLLKGYKKQKSNLLSSIPKFFQANADPSATYKDLGCLLASTTLSQVEKIEGLEEALQSGTIAFRSPKMETQFRTKLTIVEDHYLQVTQLNETWILEAKEQIRVGIERLQEEITALEETLHERQNQIQLAEQRRECVRSMETSILLKKKVECCCSYNHPIHLLRN